MVKISIVRTKEQHLDNLYYHLSVQSLLDLKAVNGEVTRKILDRIYDSSSIVKTVLYGNKIAYVVFILPTEVNEYSVFLISTTLGYSDSKELEESFSSIIRDLPKGLFYSIVYKGNHRYTKLLKNNGFEFNKEIIHGVEKRTFILLGKENGV